MQERIVELATQAVVGPFRAVYKTARKKYSNKLSMKALAGWKHFLIDSTFRIGTVLEWVFQLVILLNSCFQSDNM